MKLDVRFDNLEEVKQFYDPLLVEKAAHETVKQLHSKAATLVSKEARENYAIKARDIRLALKKRVTTQGGIPVGYLVYTGARVSLRRFSSYGGAGEPAQRARPKVKTRAGGRRGARVRVVKKRPSRIVKGAFWGRGAGGGEWQIFKRIGLSRLKIKKLTGPSIAHMVRNDESIQAINDLVGREGNGMLIHNLDHFVQRKTGLR